MCSWFLSVGLVLEIHLHSKENTYLLVLHSDLMGLVTCFQNGVGVNSNSHTYTTLFLLRVFQRFSNRTEARFKCFPPKFRASSS